MLKLKPFRFEYSSEFIIDLLILSISHLSNILISKLVQMGISLRNQAMFIHPNIVLLIDLHNTF